MKIIPMLTAIFLGVFAALVTSCDEKEKAPEAKSQTAADPTKQVDTPAGKKRKKTGIAIVNVTEGIGVKSQKNADDLQKMLNDATQPKAPEPPKDQKSPPAHK